MRLRELRKLVEQVVASGGGGGGAVPTVLMYGQLRALVPAGYTYHVSLDDDVPGETDPVFGNAIETPFSAGVPDYSRTVTTQVPGSFDVVGDVGFITNTIATSFPTELVEIRIPVHFSHTDGESGSGTLKIREPSNGPFHTVDQIAFGVNS